MPLVFEKYLSFKVHIFLLLCCDYCLAVLRLDRYVFYFLKLPFINLYHLNLLSTLVLRTFLHYVLDTIQHYSIKFKKI